MSIKGGKVSSAPPLLYIEQQMAGNRKAFTLIEIALVMLLVGVLAGVAVPRYTGAKDRAFVAAMKADLHVVAIYQEQYAVDNHGQYFSGTATSDAPLNGFRPSKDVTVTLFAFNILDSRLAGWTAVARHPKSSESCELRTGIISCTTDSGMATGILN
jgi:prepilin-type N-terminal cleavage/methylation domain-containing protein